MEAIRRLFTPEFRNRIDAIIQFAPLSKPTIERVVEKLLVEVEMQLEQKGVQLTVDDAARGWLAEQGYDPKHGRAPDGAADPGPDQAAAGRGAAVRQAGRRRWQVSVGGARTASCCRWTSSRAGAAGIAASRWRANRSLAA